MRYRKVKRILSGLLTAVMLTGQVPEVLAAGNDNGTEDAAVDIVAEEDTDELSVSGDGLEDIQAGDEEIQVPEAADLGGLVPDVDYIEGHLVSFADDEEEAAALAEYYGGKVDSFDGGIVIIELQGITVAQAMAMDVPEGFDFVEPDYIYKAQENVVQDIDVSEIYDDEEGESVPKKKSWGDWFTDDQYGDKYLNTTIDEYQWMHDFVHSYSAWGVTTGSPSVRVAVIGSGIDAAHPDFADYDGSNNRAVCNVVGEYAYKDVNGNGTHSAGIIGAGLQNGHEAVGIAPGVKLLGIRVADDDSIITSSRMASAIDSIASISSDADKVDIILLDTLIDGNMGSVYVKAEQEAITKAVKNGITVIAGAGDGAANIISYPACYEGVISVGAVNIDGNVAGFSNRGSSVDIYAPGVDLYSTGQGTSYFSRSSTSVAASVVAGVAALYMSAKGHVAPDVMKKVLLENKSDLNIVDAAKMFSTDAKATAAPKVTINDGYKNVFASYTGGSNTAGTVAGDGAITLEAMNYAGKPGKTGNAVLIYSTDGKAPQMKNGELTHGKVYNGSVSLNEFYKDNSNPSSKVKVTLIAAAVTGLGVMSKTTTVNFTIDPKAVSKPMSLAIKGIPTDSEEPPCIPLGYSIQLKSESSGVDVNTISWSITDTVNCKATISQNGVLTTKTDSKSPKDGYVVVQCKATSPKEIAAVVKIKTLADEAPIGTITLDRTKADLSYSDDDQGYVEVCIDKLLYSDGKKVRTMLYSLDWSSSDENVATVEQDEEKWDHAYIYAQGAGKCTISVAPLDGSGKKASITVNVTRVPDHFRIDGPDQVSKSKSYNLKLVAFEPKESATDKVAWMLASEVPGVKLDPKTGKLSITSKAEEGDSFTVIAEAGTHREEKDIEILKGKCDTLIVSTLATAQHYQIKSNKKGSITSINLFTKDPAAVKGTTSVKINAEGYYKGDDLGLSCNFKSNNTKVVSVTETTDGGAILKAEGKGSTTVTCTYADSSRKKVSFTVKVTEPVEKIKVTGQSAIVVGKSVTFKAKEFTPATAGNKKVTWSISDNIAGVTVNAKTGKVKLVSTPSVNSVTVVATASDGSGVKGTMDFVVCTEKTKSIDLDTIDDETTYNIKRAKKTDKLQTARLYTVNIPRGSLPENRLNLLTDSKYALDWTSSDPNVAKVEPSADGKRAVVIGVGRGTATITCKAQDGSKKKASMKVTVKVPASALKLVPQDGQNTELHFLAYGKSVSINTVLGKAFGTPSNTKIDYEYTFSTVSVERDDEGNPVGFDLEEMDGDFNSLKSRFDFVPVDGVLTMPKYSVVKDQVKGDDEKGQFILAITVTAVTDEGMGYEASKTFIAVPSIQNMKVFYEDIDMGDEFGLQEGVSRAYDVKCTYQIGTGGGPTKFVSGLTVKSSDPKVLSAYYDDAKGKLVVTGHKPGNVKLTLTSKDGSGTKLVMSVSVNPK